MIKREKTMKGLACHADSYTCDSCPYNNDIEFNQSCADKLICDAFGLLKEQDEGIAPIESTTEQKKFADRIGFAVSEYWCGDCHFNLFNRPKFCPNCGKKVKWDD